MRLSAKTLPIACPLIAGHCVAMILVHFMQGELLLSGLMFVFSAGFMCNWLVLSANGWKMPVSGRGAYTAGIHVKMESHHRFTILADRIPVSTLRMSIGDVLILSTIGPMVGLLLPLIL